MAETHQVVTKVWIAPGCIVCDSCENDCPEVFDVQEQTCIIRPPALTADFVGPLTPSIIVAAEGCPVDVIKFETKEVPGAAPWEGQEQEAAAGGAAKHATVAVAKAAAPMAPIDPKWQALLTTSRISPSLSAGLASTIRRSPEINQAAQIVQEVNLPKNAPPDQRMAMLAVGGAYQPAASMAQRLRDAAAKAREAGKVTRREFSLALAVAWGAMAAAGGASLLMFQDFFGPKILKEPKTIYRVGRVEDFGNANTVYEQFKPDGIWMVNLQPVEKRIIALSTICTHLGCIPNWLAGERKFKCPCHGSGYYITGVNFEGPTPRPLERFAISRDADGYIVVDKSRVFRSELGEWDSPDAYIPLG